MSFQKRVCIQQLFFIINSDKQTHLQVKKTYQMINTHYYSRDILNHYNRSRQ